MRNNGGKNVSIISLLKIKIKYPDTTSINSTVEIETKDSLSPHIKHQFYLLFQGLSCLREKVQIETINNGKKNL